MIADFITIINNYYTSKIYNLTNSTINNITISFRNVCDALILIRSFYGVGDSTNLNDIQQVVLKIEIELARGSLNQHNCYFLFL
jgi:hypothetical protein